MADADGVNVSQAAQKLVHVELDEEHWHGLLHLGVVSRCSVDCLWHVFEDKIQEDFVFLLT